MGREIRRVPPAWQHPRDDRGNLQPMRNMEFAQAAKEWKDGLARWEGGERPEYCGAANRTLEWWEWEGSPPDRKFFLPYTREEATWYQLFETVSEGTPISPPFATLDELSAYLAEHGDSVWRGAWGPEAATEFIEDQKSVWAFAAGAERDEKG